MGCPPDAQLFGAAAVFTHIYNESISIARCTKSRVNWLIAIKTVRKTKRSREMSLEVREFQRGKTMAKYALISLCRMAPSRANQRAARRKTFSFAAVAALFLLAIG